MGIIADAAWNGAMFATKFFLDDDQGDTRLTVNEGGTEDTGAAFRAYSLMLWSMQPTNMAGRNGYSDQETGFTYSPSGGYYSQNMGMWTQPSFPGTLGGSSAYSAGDGDPFEDDLSEATSLGDFYGRAGRKGARELLGMPQFAPGSKERQEVSGMLDCVPA